VQFVLNNALSTVHIATISALSAVQLK